jgi:hypothetical protein
MRGYRISSSYRLRRGTALRSSGKSVLYLFSVGRSWKSGILSYRLLVSGASLSCSLIAMVLALLTASWFDQESAQNFRWSTPSHCRINRVLGLPGTRSCPLPLLAPPPIPLSLVLTRERFKHSPRPHRHLRPFQLAALRLLFVGPRKVTLPLIIHYRCTYQYRQ